MVPEIDAASIEREFARLRAFNAEPELPLMHITVNHPGIDRQGITAPNRRRMMDAIRNAMSVQTYACEWPHHPNRSEGSTAVRLAYASVVAYNTKGVGSDTLDAVRQILTGKLADIIDCSNIVASPRDSGEQRFEIRVQAADVTPYAGLEVDYSQNPDGGTIDDLRPGEVPAREIDTPADEVDARYAHGDAFAPEGEAMPERQHNLNAVTPGMLSTTVGEHGEDVKRDVAGGGGSSGRTREEDKPGMKLAKQQGPGPRWVEDEPRDQRQSVRFSLSTAKALEAASLSPADALRLGALTAMREGSVSVHTMLAALNAASQHDAFVLKNATCSPSGDPVG